MSEYDARVFCPACEHDFSTQDVSELTSIEDHGKCFNCQRMVLYGEMCGICYDMDHKTYECDLLADQEEEEQNG